MFEKLSILSSQDEKIIKVFLHPEMREKVNKTLLPKLKGKFVNCLQNWCKLGSIKLLALKCTNI